MIKEMAQKYIENPDTIPQEYIEKGYEFVKEYCEQERLDIKKFIKDPANISTISNAIYKALPFTYRLMIKAQTIQEAIEPNHIWVVKKFNDLEKAAKSSVSSKIEKAAKPSKAKKLNA